MKILATIAVTIGLLAIGITPSHARYGDLDVGFEDGDIEMIGEAARSKMDNKPIGTINKWINEESGSKGYVELKKIFEYDGHPCRNILHTFYTKEKGRYMELDVDLCKINDEWKWPRPPKLKM